MKTNMSAILLLYIIFSTSNSSTHLILSSNYIPNVFLSFLLTLLHPSSTFHFWSITTAAVFLLFTKEQSNIFLLFF